MVDRHLSHRAFDAMLPARFARSLDAPWSFYRMRNAWASRVRTEGPAAAERACREHTRVALEAAQRSGASLGMNDLHPLPDKPSRIADVLTRVCEVQACYDEGLITDGERYNKSVDLWSDCHWRLNDATQKHHAASPSPLDTWSDRGVTADRRAMLRAMVGLTSMPSGALDESPVVQSFGEGLAPEGFFRRAVGDRRARLDEIARDHAVAALRTTLLWALDRWTVTADDCGSTEGLELAPTPEDSTRAEFALRLMGRTLCRDVVSAAGERLARRGERLDEPRVERVVRAEIGPVCVRWALGCNARKGLCARCFGDGWLLQPTTVGAPVGVRAAHAIAHHARALRTRGGSICGTAQPTMHVGGVTLAPARGRVRWGGSDAVLRDGSWLVLRSGFLQVIDAHGREVDVAMTAPGDRIFVDDGQRVEAGDELVRPWRRGQPFLAVIPEGATAVVRVRAEPWCVAETLDASTGLTQRTVVADEGVTLMLVGVGIASPLDVALPKGAVLAVADGDEVTAGTLLGWRLWGDVRDPDVRITEGLDGVVSLLNGRITWHRARLAPCAGWCSLEGPSRRPDAVRIRASARDPGRRVTISTRDHLAVSDGAWVNVGDRLTHGTRSHRDLLRLWGRSRLAAHMLGELVEAFSRAGAYPDSADLELVLCAMLDRVRVHDAGDSGLPVGIVSRARYLLARDQAVRAGVRAPRATERLEGIGPLARRALR